MMQPAELPSFTLLSCTLLNYVTSSEEMLHLTEPWGTLLSYTLEHTELRYIH
jgi:hypothetical protein